MHVLLLFGCVHYCVIFLLTSKNYSGVSLMDAHTNLFPMPSSIYPFIYKILLYTFAVKIHACLIMIFIKLIYHFECMWQ